MPEYHAGDAKLHIVPDATNFKKELEARLKSIQTDYKVDVDLDLTKAKARLAELGRGQDASVNVDVDLTVARTSLLAFRQEQARIPITIPVDLDTAGATAHLAAWRAEQRANALNIPVNADISPAMSGMKSLSNAIDGVLGGMMSIGKTSGVTLLIADLPAAITLVAQLGAALEQLSGAALVLPGAMAAAAASIGTLMVGVSGVKEAFTALSATTDDNASRMKSLLAAQNSLRNAMVDEKNAQKDLGQARRDATNDLRDLNMEARSGTLSVAEAHLETLKSRRDLAQGHYKDSLDYASARLRVMRSDQSEADARERLRRVTEKKHEEDTKGVEGSDRVLAAQERLVRSMQAVASAQEAMAGAGGMDKVQEAMAKLSPNAQEFVRALVAMKPAWEDLKKTVSGNLFEGMGNSFTTFFNTLLPHLKTGMGSIATAWNSNLKTLMSSLSSVKGQGLLDQILGNTAEAQRRFSAAIDPLVRGFGTLIAAGTKALPGIADTIGKVSERFATFIEKAAADGRLDKWINAGLDGFGKLGTILLNLGSAFHSIVQASGGNELLGNIEQTTKKWATFLSSTEGQDKLKNFFAEGKRELDELKQLAEKMIDLLPKIWNGFKDALSGIMPLVKGFLDVMNAIPGGMETLIALIVGAKLIGGISNLITNVGNIGSAIGNMAQGAMGAFGRLGGSIGSMAGSAASLLGGVGAPLALLAAATIPSVINWLSKMDDKNKESAGEFKKLNDEVVTLEQSLDRVTGKITELTRSSAIDQAKKYSGTGGRVKGDALEAATKLGIPPDVYADALMGDQAAINKVNDILVKNNLAPELAARGPARDLVGKISSLNSATHNLGEEKLGELLAKALAGDPAAIKRYNELVSEQDQQHENVTLEDIRRALAPSGQQAVMAGGALQDALKNMPRAETGKQRELEALRGRWNLNQQGANDTGLPVGTKVFPVGDGSFRVNVPNISPEVRKHLDAMKISPHEAYDGSWEFDLPKGYGGAVQQHAAGGPTSAGLALLHDDEFVLSPRAKKYPMSFKHALNEGRIDPSMIPHFDLGGPVEFPDSWMGPAGPPPTGGGFGAAAGHFMSGLGSVRGLTSGFGGGSGGAGFSPLGFGSTPFPLAPGPGDPAPVPSPSPSPSPTPAPTPTTPMPDIHGGGGGAPPGPTTHGGGTGEPPGPAGTGGLDAPLDRHLNLPFLGFNIPIPLGPAPPIMDTGKAVDGDDGDDFLHRWFDWLPKGGQPFDLGTMLQGMPEHIQPQRIAMDFATEFYMGGLRFFGLENSILSPQNRYIQAGIKGFKHYKDRFGVSADDDVDGDFAGAPEVFDIAPTAGHPTPAPAPAAGAAAPAATAAPAAATTQALPYAGSSGKRGGVRQASLTTGGGGGAAAAGDIGQLTMGDYTGPDDKGGFPAWLRAIGAKFGLTPSTYGGHQTSDRHEAGFAPNPNHYNRGVDWNGSTEQLQQFAEFAAQNASLFEQVIWSNPKTGQHIGIAGGHPVGDGYYSGDWGGHTTHVHTRFSSGFMLDSLGGGGGGGGGGLVSTAGSTRGGGLSRVPLRSNTGGQLYYQDSGGKFRPASAAYAGSSRSRRGGVRPAGMSAATGGAPAAGTSGSPQSIVHAAMLAAGFGEDQWSALNEIISHESGWNPTIPNGQGSGAYGLFQFLGATKDHYLGGDNPDVATQANAGMRYIRDRYGTPAAAWNFWQGHHWYDDASLTNPKVLKPGVTIAHNDTGRNEYVVGSVPGFLDGGVPSGLAQLMNPVPPPLPPKPMPDPGPPAQHLIPPSGPAPQPSAPMGPGPAPSAPPDGARPAPGPAAAAPADAGGQGPGGAPPSPQGERGSHTLPALDTAIKSGASALGNAAAAAASMGMGGMGGGAGSMIAGLFTQGGKIVSGVANVASSLLVGSVSDIGGNTGNAYGKTYMPAQAQPQTAGNRHTTNYNGGIVVADPQELRRELDVRDAQHYQSSMANRN